MHIGHLRIKDFRNYQHSEIDFSDGLNVIHGRNGQGKTSILEAIYYLCLSRSFKTQDDASVVRFDQTFFDIDARVIRPDQNLQTSVRVIVHRSEGKSVLVDRKKLERFSELIGRFPAVVSAPEDVAIVSGTAAQRRRWLDIALSQIHRIYLKDLQAYRQALRQRNALLDSDHVHLASLDAWDQALAQHGARVVLSRIDFVETFAGLVEEVYSQVCGGEERIHLDYRTTVTADMVRDVAELQKQFLDALIAGRGRDIQRRSSGCGPHKDDLIFLLNGRNIRECGSQGQLKTFALALKFAEYLYVADRLEARPLLLLDDVFSELDWTRRHRLVRYLDNAGQVFLTSADYLPAFDVRKDTKYLKVEQALVTEAMPEPV